MAKDGYSKFLWTLVIWNGYDAHAKEVRVNTICENTFDSIIKVIVRDDGDGIIHEQLPVVFKKFYESHKSVKGNVDSRFSRGKNGYGRFLSLSLRT